MESNNDIGHSNGFTKINSIELDICVTSYILTRYNNTIIKVIIKKHVSTMTNAIFKVNFWFKNTLKNVSLSNEVKFWRLDI